MQDDSFIHAQVARIRGDGTKPLDVRLLKRELALDHPTTRSDRRIGALIAKDLLSATTDAQTRHICLRAWDEFSPALGERQYNECVAEVQKTLLTAYPDLSLATHWLQILNGVEAPPTIDNQKPHDPARVLLYAGEIYLAWREFQEQDDPNDLRGLAYLLLLDSTNLAARARTLAKTGPTREAVRALLILTARGESSLQGDRSLRHVMKAPILEALCTASTLSLAQTLRALGLVDELPDFEDRLLALAALARVQRQDRKAQYAATTEAVYLERMAKLRVGAGGDPWNLLKDSYTAPITLKTRPSGAFGRWREGVSLSWRLAGILGPRRTSMLLTGHSRQVKPTETELRKISGEISAYVARLKGPMMKLGQTASYFSTGLPDPTMGPLRALQTDAEPTPWPEVEDALARALGPKWANFFSSIDTKPVGIGSIAQVHRAHLATGEAVALKIRLPGIEDVIRSDLALIRGLIHMHGFALSISPFHGRDRLTAIQDMRGYIDELEKQMLLECDFRNEADAMERARKRFADDPTLHIPSVFCEISSAEVLVQEFVEGRRFDQVLTDSNEEQRDAWGQAIVRFVVTSCRDADFNSDPHPGNFLFSERGVHCLDFGSTIRWDDETKRAWNLLILACTEKDFDLFKNAFRIPDKDDHSADRALFTALGSSGPGSWNHPVHQALSSEAIAEHMHALSRSIDHGSVSHGIKFPPIFLFGLRVYFGHLSLVARLGSRANWNDFARAIMLAPPANN